MATIIMSAEKVIAACENVIRHIEIKRNEKDEKVIQRTMSQKRGIFKRYYFVRSQAIDYLCNNEDFFTGWRSNYAWGDLEHARKLLVLAQYGDPVTLNEEDTRVLFSN